MARYFILRFLRALLSLFAVTTFAFFVLMASGDPAEIMLSPDTPTEVVEAFRRTWGLDQPLWQQYLRYWGNIMHGDFGQSMRDGRPALDVILSRLPATLALAIPALCIKVMIGVPAGVCAALMRNTWVDRATIFASVLGYAIPNFVMGFLLVVVFTVKLGGFSSGGFATPNDVVLPAITLGTAGAAIIARFTRSAMVDVLGQPYVRAAQAKGLPWRRVVVRHVLPNAAIPTVTIIGLMVAGLVGGAVVVETVFSWPGVGRLLVQSVSTRDLMVVQALLLMIAAAVVTANLIVDLLYGVLDPRVRVQRGSGA
jgi:peptide/nickel transport system permease protein